MAASYKLQSAANNVDGSIDSVVNSVVSSGSGNVVTATAFMAPNPERHNMKPITIFTAIFKRSVQRLSHGIVLFAATLSSTWAADFAVIVKEKGNGTPILGASVVLGGTSAHATSDDSGRVTFRNIDYPSSLRVLAAGFETLNQPLKPGQDVYTVYLEPLTVTTEGVEVVAERLTDKSGKLSLSRSDLANAPGSQGDPLKAIGALPGMVSAGDGSGVVYMRGSGADDNIVWMNRAPVGYLYHFDGLQSTVPAALVEDINVFSAGFPVEYGDALGGAIDVRLRGPRRDRRHYQFDISTYAAGFLVEGPLAGTQADDGFYIAARRSYVDLLFSPADFSKLTSNDEGDNPDRFVQVPRFSDVQALYHRELSQGTVDTYLFTASDSLALELNDSAKSDPQTQGETKSTLRFLTVGSTWQQRWGDDLDHVVNLAYSANEENTHLGRDPQGEPFFSRAEIRQVHLQPEIHWRASAHDDWHLGAAADYFDAPVSLYIARTPSEDDVNYDFTGQPKYRLEKTLYARSTAPYAKYRRQWTDRLATVLGLRYSDIRVTGGFAENDYSPRASLEYAVTSRTLLTAAWGRYIQLPQAAEIIENFGNPRLGFERAEHRVIGIRHRYDDLYSVQVEAYHKPMRELVVAIDERTPPDNYANEGEGDASGLDIYLKREARNGKLGWLSLSYAKSRRTNRLTGVSRDFTGDQPVTLNAVWGQPFGGNWKRWSWSTRWQIHSGAPYTAVTGRHKEDPDNPTSRWIAEYGEHNAERTPVYFKVDLRFDREFLFNEWKAKLYLDLQNVTFRNNVTGYDYGSEYQNIGNPKKVTGMPFFPFFGIAAEY